LVSDLPMTDHGVKTQASDAHVDSNWSDVHLDIGIESLTELGEKGEEIKHFRY
jgi:AMP nucleosidase